MAELSEQKQEARAMWAMGDYPSIVHRIEGAGVAAVKAAQIDESDTVLDVACGSGNATIPAAKTGATVTGLDITPELLEAGRANAAEAGVEIDWIEGAPGRRRELRRGGLRVRLHVRPGPRQAAGEIARVLAPGGRIAICAWTPEGSIGRFFMTVAKHMPPPPEGFEPPILWGTEDHVRDLFAGTAVELEFEKAAVDFVADSTGEFMEEYENSLPPTVAAKAALEPQGKWDACGRTYSTSTQPTTRPTTAASGNPPSSWWSRGRRRTRRRLRARPRSAPSGARSAAGPHPRVPA